MTVILKDIFGETQPRGSKIYAIRPPAATSSSHILAQERSVGIVFNWQKTVGFRRAGDNARAFVFRPNFDSTYGSLLKAYEAATEFLEQPSVHEGPLPTDENTLAATLEPLPTCPWYMKLLFVLKLAFRMFMARLGITSKSVLAGILLSLLLFGSYNAILYLQQQLNCVPRENTSYSQATYNSLHPWCSNLVSIQLHVQNHAVEYTNLFFAQLKVGFVILMKHIVDEMFA